MLLQFDLKHIHKVNFYPSDNNFTQALLVLLVTNMISAADPPFQIVKRLFGETCVGQPVKCKMCSSRVIPSEMGQF